MALSKLERPDTLRKVAELAGLGLSWEHIAGVIQTSHDTFKDWMRRGETDISLGKRRSKYARLYLIVSSAEGGHYVQVFSDLKAQSKGGNDRAAKFLAEQSPHYRHDQNVNITVTAERLRELSTEELIRLRQGDSSPLNALQKPQ